MGTPRVILASASPRRRDLLSAAGLEFSVEKSDVDEDLPRGIEPERAAGMLAERKAAAVAARHRDRDRIVVGADTVVAIDVEGEHGAAPLLLGKPADEDEARGMLRRLSGSRHRVVTGVAVVRTRDGRTLVEVERTWVRMRPIADEEVEAYVASGEWRDKAGGYAIQENADAFVLGLEEGGFDNVVGLPVARTLALVARLAGER